MLSTYNEKENIGPMIQTLAEIGEKLSQYEFVTLVVDSHSPDGTGDIVREIARTQKNVFLLETPRGLGISLIKGYQHAMNELKADIVISNDCDFQWDPQLIPTMLEKMEAGYDVVVPSRHVKGGKDNFTSFRKLTHFVSNTLLNHYWAGIREIKDLAGNFKAIRVKGILDKVDLDKLNVRGFVIQSTMIYELSKTGAKFIEIPAIFGARRAGETKVGFNTQFIKDVLETIKNSTRIRLERSAQFFRFCVVGGIGFVINTVVLRVLAEVGHWHPAVASSTGAEMAIISNFMLNNFWTFKSSKFTSWKKIPFKFLQFNMTSLGAILIQFVVIWLGVHFFGRALYMFYYVFSVGLGLIWNYFMYTTVVWKTKNKSAAQLQV